MGPIFVDTESSLWDIAALRVSLIIHLNTDVADHFSISGVFMPTSEKQAPRRHQRVPTVHPPDEKAGYEDGSGFILFSANQARE
jgi:hypothetical protein